MTWMKAEELCRLGDFMLLTFPCPGAAEPNRLLSLCLVPSLGFPWHGEENA